MKTRTPTAYHKTDAKNCRLSSLIRVQLQLVYVYVPKCFANNIPNFGLVKKLTIGDSLSLKTQFNGACLCFAMLASCTFTRPLKIV